MDYVKLHPATWGVSSSSHPRTLSPRNRVSIFYLFGMQSTT